MNYNFDNRYYLEANFRYDGLSRFASGHRWGWFPSFSGAWAISEENFMEDVGFIDFLKVRGSRGRLGNQDIDLFQYLAPVAINNTYVFGESAARGAYQTSLPGTKLFLGHSTK